jgi:hypothetical protein
MAWILIVLFLVKIEENSNGEVKEIVKEVIKEEPEDEKKEEKEEEKGEGDSKVKKITVPGTQRTTILTTLFSLPRPLTVAKFYSKTHL